MARGQDRSSRSAERLTPPLLAASGILCTVLAAQYLLDGHGDLAGLFAAVAALSALGWVIIRHLPTGPPPRGD
jgi:hypothetical protein